MKTIRMILRGRIQGVGFRPWVFRQAYTLGLKGFVQNTTQGVCIEIEGPDHAVESFQKLLKTDLPDHCVITQQQCEEIIPRLFKKFEIIPSQELGVKEAIVLPDIATCPQCLEEIFDTKDPRYLYPFTNCTHCGPRYSIIETLPYDRENTSMKHFKMCPTCTSEFSDPFNRRFHAQPNACPDCGPQLSFLDPEGHVLASRHEGLLRVVEVLKKGAIVAVKSMGGFHLMVDATNEKAVQRLRQLKHRPDKPLAVMMPSMEMVAQYCHLSVFEEQALKSPATPIVLLQKQEGLNLAASVAPDNPYLGCMLPNMPLHHILMRLFNKPLVATSGNLSDEPICIDNEEAVKRLGGIVDYFLVHDRPIVRQVDDSVVQVINDVVCALRCSRGIAPLVFDIKSNTEGFLAVGAQQKNTIAIGLRDQIIISQHIGDLDNSISCQAFERTIESLTHIYNAPMSNLICDKHSGYTSNQYAHSKAKDVLEVQHHHAHVASCMAEHGLEGEVLGVCFDGTGLGLDGTIWGGEFLRVKDAEFSRLGHLGLFPLAGGDIAIKEPRRSALGLLYMIGKSDWEQWYDLASIKAFTNSELRLIQLMIEKRLNTPMTSSMGRLFDGVASLIGLCQQSSFEGQAAMALEFQANEQLDVPAYPFHVSTDGIFDCKAMLKDIIRDYRRGVSRRVIATRFHRTITEMIVSSAHWCGLEKVILSGGCFQNKVLTQMAVKALREEGFMPFWHQQIPTNDGGVVLGQMFIAAKKSNYVLSHSRKN